MAKAHAERRTINPSESVGRHAAFWITVLAALCLLSYAAAADSWTVEPQALQSRADAQPISLPQGSAEARRH
jgi:hypothetical protein